MLSYLTLSYLIFYYLNPCAAALCHPARRKKLKQHKFTLRLSRLPHQLLMQFLSSELGPLPGSSSPAMMLLTRLINTKLTLVVRTTDLPESYTVSGPQSQSQSQVQALGAARAGEPSDALQHGSCMVPAFEVQDYYPSLHRRGLPVVDCYMPSLYTPAAVRTHSVAPSLIRVPDTKNDKFYTELLSKVVLPQQLLESASGSDSGSGSGAGVGAEAGSGPASFGLGVAQVSERAADPKRSTQTQSGRKRGAGAATGAGAGAATGTGTATGAGASGDALEDGQSANPALGPSILLWYLHPLQEPQAAKDRLLEPLLGDLYAPPAF